LSFPIQPLASSTTSSSATIYWTTNLPSSAQVRYGLSAAYGASSGLDSAPSTEHRHQLLGLLPGTTYHFRVESVDASGKRMVSDDGNFTTAHRGVRGAVDDIMARRISGSTAVISWTASTSIGQVEYGTGPTYSAFTVLRVFSSPNQEIALNNLLPQTLYHFRVKTWDDAGISTASPDFTFTTAPKRTTMLLGNSSVDERATTIPSGQAYAFQYAAVSTGLATQVRLYVDAGTTTPALSVAVYTDEAGQPGAPLAQGNLQRPIAGMWNSIGLPATGLTKGATYWIALLNPAGPGTLAVRGDSGSGASRLALQPALATFPVTWLSSPVTGTTTLSAYVQQVTPAVTLIEPADGSAVSGSVTLSATVDNEAPITSAQFLLDGMPIGQPTSVAPYTLTWDTGLATTHEFHTLSARVTDALGRVSTSTPIWLHVDNGPALTQVAASRLTATSAWISWSTDSYSDSQVEFGPSTAYGQLAPLDPSFAWLHRQQLTGLSPNTTYHYRVRSRDVRGVLGVSPDFALTTPAT
jgi:Bacterial Ig domain/Purple acid Phosphatase, N-terminal domain